MVGYLPTPVRTRRSPDYTVRKITNANGAQTIDIFLAKRTIDAQIAGASVPLAHGSKTVPLMEEKKEEKTCFFFYFREARPCLLQKQNLASHRKKRENVIFLFSRDTTVPLAEAKPCLSQKEKKSKHAFFFVF